LVLTHSKQNGIQPALTVCMALLTTADSAIITRGSWILISCVTCLPHLTQL